LEEFDFSPVTRIPEENFSAGGACTQYEEGARGSRLFLAKAGGTCTPYRMKREGIISGEGREGREKAGSERTGSGACRMITTHIDG
jgi:hypothetical protein